MGIFLEDGGARERGARREPDDIKERTIVVGDVHGCAGALRELLDRMRADPARDRLVLLGDLFDRGSDSWEVFRHVRELKSEFGSRFTLVLGNHEDYLTAEKLSFAQRRVWDRVGRRATVLSFKSHGEKMEDAAPWLRENGSLFYRDGEIQCVHAAVKVEPIEANDRRTLVHDHSAIFDNSYRGRFTVTGHVALPAVTYFAGDMRHIEEMSCGVWREIPECGMLCIDTGCGKGGRLTGMAVSGGMYRLTSVPE